MKQECARIARDGGAVQKLYGLEWARSGIGCPQSLVRGATSHSPREKLRGASRLLAFLVH